jgi:ArsR family transcriptional regulator, arsenate/arsenite/antimonite-responsive transcriptional repressor
MGEYQTVLKVIADETRFEIIALLLEKAYCVKAIARHINLSEAAISQHLQILRRAGLVKGEKRGYWTYYSVERDYLLQMVDEFRLKIGSLQGKSFAECK